MTTKLIDVIRDLSSLSDDDVLFAREPWTAESDTIVVAMDSEDAGDAEYQRRHADALARGYSEFLWVYLIRESFEEWLAKSDVSPDEKCARIIYYAVNDA